MRPLLFLLTACAAVACSTLDGLSSTADADGGVDAAPDAPAPGVDAAAVADASVDGPGDASSSGLRLRTQSTATGNGSLGTIELTVPTETRPGDLLWIVLLVDDSPSISKPAEVTLVGEQSNICDVSKLALFAGQASSTTPSKLAFALGSAQPFEAALFVFEGVDPTVRGSALAVIDSAADPWKTGSLTAGSADVPASILLTYAMLGATGYATPPGTSPVAATGGVALFALPVTSGGPVDPPTLPTPPSICGYAATTLFKAR